MGAVRTGKAFSDSCGIADIPPTLPIPCLAPLVVFPLRFSLMFASLNRMVAAVDLHAHSYFIFFFFSFLSCSSSVSLHLLYTSLYTHSSSSSSSFFFLLLFVRLFAYSRPTALVFVFYRSARAQGKQVPAMKDEFS